MTSATTAPTNYMDVVYKLWEAVGKTTRCVRDRAARIFSHPGKVHRVEARRAVLFESTRYI